MLLISGTYDAENIDENTKFLETEGMLYEACPVGSALEERQTDACFTAYLPGRHLEGKRFFCYPLQRREILQKFL